MSSDKDRFTRQYDYKANSNLVLPTDTSLIDKRPNNEETGEVQSLAGRITGRMGDRVSDKPSSAGGTKQTTAGSKLVGDAAEDADKPKASHQKRRKKMEASRLKQDLSITKGLSVANIETKDLLYQPKSDQTALVYGLVIKFVRKYLGFQHVSIINGAADEVIGTVKDPALTEEMRRLEVDKLLVVDQSINDDDYNQLCNLCKKIDDWTGGGLAALEAPGGGGDEEADDANVGVVYADDADDDDDDAAGSDDYLSEVRDSDDEFDLDEMFEKANNEVDLMKPFGASMELDHPDSLNSKYKTLNLDELSRRQAGASLQVDIGEPVRREGFQEYYIVPKKRPPQQSDHQIKIADLPELEQKAFSSFKSLNLIQSKIYRRAMTSDKSLLICAPTGAGKTNIAMLTMLREILKYAKPEGGFDTEQFKIIYIAPIKALVQEIVQNFKDRLSKAPFNLKVEELTGDHQLDQRQISKAQLIVCTPEKWDIVTRKSLDRLYTKIVRLVIFDEIHLLHNERGATLEALVARIKRHRSIEGQGIRIVGLSATLPNYKDVARFIAPTESVEDSTFYFDSTYRPIPLRQQYIAISDSKKAFRMINDIVYEKVVERLVDNAQILIFVHSRLDTFKTAEYLKCKALEDNKVGLFLSSTSAIEQINESAQDMSPKLKEILQFGIGIHHAGLSRDDRCCVEDLFRGKFIKVLVSTATLAWGVNLPARVVIIKGTQVYRDGKWVDLDSLDVTQMLGRAGRPGFDKEGEGIVITQQSQVQFYMSLMSEQLPVESKLIGRLPEFINAECVVGNIESLEDAVKWISETYLSSRMLTVLKQEDSKQHMSVYGIDPDAKSNDPNLISHKYNLAYTAACTLDERGLIVFDRLSGVMRSTELGRIASHFNCSSRTIKLFFDSIHEHTSDIELFRTFSLADEFKDIFVRRGEEMDLQTLMNQVPFPIDDKRATPGANKVNALLQVFIFRLNIEGSDLICDMHFIKENAARLARAIHEIVLMKGFAFVAELSFDLCRKIDKRLTVCHSPLRQFADDLDPTVINRLEKKNYHIDELRVLTVNKLTEVLREEDAGEKVYKLLKYLPKLKIEACVKPVSRSSLRIELNIQPDFSWSEKYHGYSENFWLLVQDVNQEVLLHYEMVNLRKYNLTDGITSVFHVPYLKPEHPFYFVRILPDKWFGCDHHLPIYLNDIHPPDDAITTTQALDLEPCTLKTIENSYYENFYDEKFKGSYFNQIQTQSFKYFYSTDEDVILLASAGSGKTTCAELAMIRVLTKEDSKAKCGYIAANQEAANSIYNQWQKLFGSQHEMVLLTGNHRVDVAKVDRENVRVVIGDVQNWHVLTLTRSKKYKKLMHKFQLFVIDDIHLLYSDRSSILEWLCSKIRIITKISKQARLVVLGSPVVCADSLKSWLAIERGSNEPILLNFPVGLRPVKLELTIQKFHHYNYSMRLLTMLRPVYRCIIHDSKNKPVIVFVADFRAAQDTCEAMCNYTRSEEVKLRRPGSKFHFNEPELSELMRYGIAYVYEGMNANDRALVESLYSSDQISVLIATVSTCWSLQCRSYLTVIMDTQFHNGREPVDYELTDLMQMVGLTGRPLLDHECRCIIMCQSSKADYYERFLRDPLPVESELPNNLIALANYEIAAGSLSELNDIYKPYLAHTLFYKRISINPNYYGLIVGEDPEKKSKVFGTYFNDLVNRASLELEKSEFVSLEGSPENPTFNTGLIAKISLEYYINYETLRSYVKWLTVSTKPLDLRPFEMIEMIASNTAEFKDIPVSYGELTTLKTLQRRYKCYDDELYSVSTKIKLLILSQYQRTEGKEDPVEGELVAHRYFIVGMCYRLLMAIVDIAWLKDSFSLAKTAIQLLKKLAPSVKHDPPSIEMDVNMSKEEDLVKIEVTINRNSEPIGPRNFAESNLPASLARDEGWCFLIYGQSKSGNDPDKFSLFKRVKTPTLGANEYKLEFEIPDNSDAFTYDLYFMSDFYPRGEDRKVSNIDITGLKTA